jgi:hypothetical protein
VARGCKDGCEQLPGRELRGQIVDHAHVFALDLHRALVEQLPRALSDLGPAPLTPANLSVLGVERGVYQLFERDKSVYVGKSDKTLADRLEEHRQRCSGRWNIDVTDMSFRCLYVDAFVDAASPERQLIASYKRSGLAPWNFDVGFAPKDVGRNRDGGRPGQWFLERPVNYDALIELPGGARRRGMLDTLELLRRLVSFDLFRFASSRSHEHQDRLDAERDYPDSFVDTLAGQAPVIEHLRVAVAQLPPGWQATILPQGVILYKESRRYAYALAGWRRTSTGVDGLGCGSAVR